MVFFNSIVYSFVTQFHQKSHELHPKGTRHPFRPIVHEIKPPRARLGAVAGNTYSRDPIETAQRSGFCSPARVLIGNILYPSTCHFDDVNVLIHDDGMFFIYFHLKLVQQGFRFSECKFYVFYFIPTFPSFFGVIVLELFS